GSLRERAALGRLAVRVSARDALDPSVGIVRDQRGVGARVMSVWLESAAVQTSGALLASGWLACTPQLARTRLARPPIPQWGRGGSQSNVCGALVASCASCGDTARHTPLAEHPVSSPRRAHAAGRTHASWTR